LPGHVARITDSTAVVTTVNDLVQYTDWAQGQLVFKATPVSVLLATVGRWYGYQFRVADSALATEKVSIAFKVSDPEETMTIIKGLLNVDLKFDGTVVTLVPHRGRRDQRMPARQNVSPPILEVGR
jgi:ferric-dicitrate binding protein FerR (iron transport regulator)